MMLEEDLGMARANATIEKALGLITVGVEEGSVVGDRSAAHLNA
jgi:hypothetical protein